MRMLDARWARIAAVWIAATIAACSDPRCPYGYRKEHDTCFLIRDAGDDAETSEDDGEPDSGSDDAASERLDGDVDGLHDAGAKPEDADLRDSTSSDSEPPTTCARKCAEHEVCKAESGPEVCACASGYSTCGQACKDLMSDPLNCGACGYACAEGLACKQGQCEQKIRELVLDASVSCALYDSPDGNFPLKCWGDTRFGLFRAGVAEALAPREISGVPRVRTLAVPAGRYCAVLPGEDAIRCWGICGLECGNPPESPTMGATFSRDVSIPGVIRISGAGYDYSSGWNTCALAASGRVDCWGSSYLIGGGANRNTPAPAIVEGTSAFASLDGGSSHTCASSRDGRVACWGWHTGDALGFAAELVSNDEAYSGVFVPKELGGALTGVTKVAAGINSCAVTRDGELWCWGSNDGRGSAVGPGVLGVGDTVRHVGAVKVALNDVVDIDVGGGGHACAIVRGGQVYCWGRVEWLGLGSGIAGDAHGGTIFSTPQAIPGLRDAVEIRTGEVHSCARRRNGQVLCWGANELGQLGDGTKVARVSPTPVIGLY